MREHAYFVYILANRSRNTYIGVTNNLQRRIREHKERRNAGYAANYGIDRLVYYELHQYVINALTRETEIKAWRREKKTRLIESVNPSWQDLSQELWIEKADSSASRSE